MAVAQASLENLKKGKKFTSETAREAGKKGQEKSLEVRRWKRVKKDFLEIITGLKGIDDGVFDYLLAHGFDEDTLGTIMRLVATIGIHTMEYASKP